MPNLKNSSIRHIVALAVTIDDKQRLLLTKRYNPSSRFAHNKWQFPGGGVEIGEHPEETIVREMKEETGLDVELLSRQPAIFTHTFPDGTNVLLFGYPVKAIGGELDITRDTETGDACWFAYKDIDFDSALPLTKEIIDDIRERLE